MNRSGLIMNDLVKEKVFLLPELLSIHTRHTYHSLQALFDAFKNVTMPISRTGQQLAYIFRLVNLILIIWNIITVVLPSVTVTCHATVPSILS